MPTQSIIILPFEYHLKNFLTITLFESGEEYDIYGILELGEVVGIP